MADIAQNNSFGFVLPKTPTSQGTCNICKRLLYQFEEVLRCRSCNGSNHWRCVEPKTISQYGDNENFICAKCNDDATSNNSSFRLKSTDSTNGNNRSTETSVGNTIRYFEEKQQQQQQQQRPQTPKMTKISELDRYLPPIYNHTEYQYNGQDQNDRRTPQQQRHQNGLESDDEHDSSAMFQANYEYTSLKDYAAMKTVRARSENNINEYPSSSSNQQTTSRYGGGLHYTNHGYDPTVSRLVEPPAFTSTDIISPSLNSRPNHFISTSNLTINERPSDHSQQQLTSPIRSPAYPLQPEEQPSTLGNDASIIMTKSHTDQTKGGTQGVERKLTDLVQQLGKQLETDAQKINEKLEVKIKNLENMIHEQTSLIQRQEEVIERLKTKVTKFESDYEQISERNDTNTFIPNENEQPSHPTQNNHINRKYSSSSTTITQSSMGSTKKTPAPRLNQQWSVTSNENKPPVKKLVNKTPIGRDRQNSDSSSMPSMGGILASSIPVMKEPKAASSRLDHIIHQIDSTVSDNQTSDYNLAPVRHQNRSQVIEPISMVQEQIVTTVHHDDHNNNNAPKKPQNISKSIVKSKRSSSLSSNSSSEPVKKSNMTATATSNRSFDSIPNNQPLRPSDKASTVESSRNPVQQEDSGSTYITPFEGNQSRDQANSIVKGWLRKQNRDSFLKRIEPYYCILANNALLMHRNDQDRTPTKAISLKGAKVRYYDDAKNGPSLELNWANRSNEEKHYHLYAPNQQEAKQWVMAIQNTIDTLNSKDRWQQYHLNL